MLKQGTLKILSHLKTLSSQETYRHIAVLNNGISQNYFVRNQLNFWEYVLSRMSTLCWDTEMDSAVTFCGGGENLRCPRRQVMVKSYKVPKARSVFLKIGNAGQHPQYLSCTTCTTVSIDAQGTPVDTGSFEPCPSSHFATQSRGLTAPRNVWFCCVGCTIL